MMLGTWSCGVAGSGTANPKLIPSLGFDLSPKASQKLGHNAAQVPAAHIRGTRVRGDELKCVACRYSP